MCFETSFIHLITAHVSTYRIISSQNSYIVFPRGIRNITQFNQVPIYPIPNYGQLGQPYRQN